MCPPLGISFVMSCSLLRCRGCVSNAEFRSCGSADYSPRRSPAAAMDSAEIMRSPPEETLRCQRTLTGSPASLRKIESAISTCRSANVINYVTFRRGFSGTEAHTMTCSLRAERGKQPALDWGFPYLNLARLVQWPRPQIRNQDKYPVEFHHRGALPFPFFSHRCLRSTPLVMAFGRGSP